MKALLKPMAILLLVGALILSMTAIVTADSQQWFLNSSNHSTVSANKVMEKSGTPTSSVTINQSTSVIWLTENAATADVTFSSGSWFVYLETTEDWGADCDISIGGWDVSNTGNEWYDISTSTGTKFSFSSGILTVEVQTGSGTISNGDYLALKIENTSSSNNHDVVTDGDSYMLSPSTDPGYPIPDIAAGILLGLGLIVMGGFLVIAKRKQNVVRV